jgi:hypothetical protein
MKFFKTQLCRFFRKPSKIIAIFLCFMFSMLAASYLFAEKSEQTYRLFVGVSDNKTVFGADFNIASAQVFENTGFYLNGELTNLSLGFGIGGWGINGYCDLGLYKNINGVRVEGTKLYMGVRRVSDVNVIIAGIEAEAPLITWRRCDDDDVQKIVLFGDVRTSINDVDGSAKSILAFSPKRTDYKVGLRYVLTEWLQIELYHTCYHPVVSGVIDNIDFQDGSSGYYGEVDINDYAPVTNRLNIKISF